MKSHYNSEGERLGELVKSQLPFCQLLVCLFTQHTSVLFIHNRRRFIKETFYTIVFVIQSSLKKNNVTNTIKHVFPQYHIVNENFLCTAIYAISLHNSRQPHFLAQNMLSSPKNVPYIKTVSQSSGSTQSSLPFLLLEGQMPN